MKPIGSLSGAVRNLGHIDRIPVGEGRMFEIDGVPVACFRARDGSVFATQALCPHKEGPLADGLIGGGQVICPLHAYKFDLETGTPVGNQCEALATYAVSVSDEGEILLRLAIEN
jgi:nitrite reductase [NAD(P)H] small subunit